MTEKTEKMTRRTALETIGIGVAAAAIVGLAANDAQAQIMSVDFVVDRYQITVMSSARHNYDYYIFLMGPFENGFRKAVHMYFMKDGLALPTNAVGDVNSAKVYYKSAQFKDVCDFLRHEKPIQAIAVNNGIFSLFNYYPELPGDLDID